MTPTYSTESLCPVCLHKLPARHLHEADRVYLVKYCPEHGGFKTLIWNGLPAIATRYGEKSAVSALPGWTREARGCPFDCGICRAHRQYACIVLIEITNRCNLQCSVCFAGAGENPGVDPGLYQIRKWYQLALESGPGVMVQLSGGEPTLRDDLPAIIALGRRMGLGFIQVNTNGLRLAAEPEFVAALAAAGLSSVYLQFDGTTEAIYRAIRGRDLLDVKKAAIENCARHNLGVVLVPTLVPGLNDQDIGNILDFAVARSPSVRGVHFQPVSYFGRYPEPPRDSSRLTLPDVMRAIEIQSRGLFQSGHFLPPGCENALCSFHCNYVIMPDGRPVPLSRASKKPADCCCPAEVDSRISRTVDYVAQQWSGSTGQGCSELNPPGRAEADCQGEDSGPIDDLDRFLSLVRRRSFTLSAMAFQDVWNLDLKRVKDCCIHVAAPDDRLIPFCIYNLTGAEGQALYRSKSEAGRA